MDMSFAELFNTLFFAAISLVAWFVPLELQQRTMAATLGASGIAVCLFMAVSPAFLPEAAGSQLRTWAPALLILLAYHQSGRLFNKPRHKLEVFLLDMDCRLLGRLCSPRGVKRIHPVLWGCLETSYLGCYVLVPAALAVLVLMGPQDSIDEFWKTVLPPTYLCYALIPLFPALPPRFLSSDQTERVDPGGVRALNLWLLRHASIRANTFPSAHVAACASASLVVLQHHAWTGSGFLGISFGIAAATVLCRYHYLADAVLGLAISFAFFAFLRI